MVSDACSGWFTCRAVRLPRFYLFNRLVSLPLPLIIALVSNCRQSLSIAVCLFFFASGCRTLCPVTLSTTLFGGGLAVHHPPCITPYRSLSSLYRWTRILTSARSPSTASTFSSLCLFNNLKPTRVRVARTTRSLVHPPTGTNRYPSYRLQSAR
jgi:hypothetical protein